MKNYFSDIKYIFDYYNKYKSYITKAPPFFEFRITDPEYVNYASICPILKSVLGFTFLDQFYSHLVTVKSWYESE